MASWEDIILAGQLDGLTFDFVSVRDDHSNTIDSQPIPLRDGTFRKPRGREGKQFEITAVFMEDDYPDTMNSLIAKLDEQKIHDFIHPIFGKFRVACPHFVVGHDAEDAADFGTIQLTLLEHSDGNKLTATTQTVPARANQVRSLGTQVLEALSTFQAALEIQNSEIGLAVIGAVNAATSIAESLEATGDDLSSIAVQSSTSVAITACDDALELVADFEITEQYDLSAVLSQMTGALSAMANDLIEQKPPLQTFSVVADTNLRSWVHDKYPGISADELEARVLEVLSLNSFPDPMQIPAGFKVTAYDE